MPVGFKSIKFVCSSCDLHEISKFHFGMGFHSRLWYTFLKNDKPKASLKIRKGVRPIKTIKKVILPTTILLSCLFFSLEIGQDSIESFLDSPLEKKNTIEKKTTSVSDDEIEISIYKDGKYQKNGTTKIQRPQVDPEFSRKTISNDQNFILSE